MKFDKKKHKKRNRKILLVVSFFTAIVLLVATYAWLSTSVNVKVQFVKMTVRRDSGLYISLDGINFSDTVVASMDSVVTDLKSVYPNHTNQWAALGLWPVSSNGIKSPNDDKFSVYAGHLVRTRVFNPNGTIKRLLISEFLPEETPTTSNSYLAFDIFLKNASGSPFSDNLYFDETTFIDFDENVAEETKEEMMGLMNSIRVGVIKIGNTVSSKSDTNLIQNIKCDNNCQSLIYEPFSIRHTADSIVSAGNYGITLVDGVYTPTYALINEGSYLEHFNGHEETGVPLRSAYFAHQETIKEGNFLDPIFEIPNGITKFRVYVWVEGQDMDSLETLSMGAEIILGLDFYKDLSGYR